MNSREELHDDLDQLFRKHFHQKKLQVWDYLFEIAALYCSLVRIAESDIEDSDEIMQIRTQAMSVIEDMIFGDGLLDEEGTTH